jgi:hypothetical protein
MTMKYLLLFVLFPVLGYAQETPKGSTAIIVSNTDLLTVGNKLLEHGFAIAKKDTKFGTIRTEDMEFDNGVWFLRINVRVKDSVATITGEIRQVITLLGRGDGTYTPVINKGPKNSGYKVSFAKMEELAKSLGGTIRYK